MTVSTCPLSSRLYPEKNDLIGRMLRTSGSTTSVLQIRTTQVRLTLALLNVVCGLLKRSPDTNTWQKKERGNVMALKRGSKVERGYATVVEEDGVNYREIADTMTEIGFTMNHSSARNYVLRVMRKFVAAMVEDFDIELDEQEREDIAKSPAFQHRMAELLMTVEMERRAEQA